MTLVDTNVIIEIWNYGNKKLIEKFKSHDIIMNGIVKSELLHGAKTTKEFNLINELLSEFDFIYPDKDYWDILGENLFKLKTNGVTVPYQDVLIATLALQNDLDLWTLDKHFKYIKNIIPELKLI